MCGIAGFIGRHPERLGREMLTALQHRGPDGQGLFFDGDAGVALVHRRLSIIDLSDTGHQPMTDRSGRFTIAYNGEIYNYRELREELIARGALLHGKSDTEVILEAFARDGVGIFERLNGIFALAIWDADARELTLARDGMGVKPLYLHDGRRGIAFASEMKALLSVPDLDRTIDPVAATAYLTYLWSPGERTMFRSVRKMEPGTWLRIGSNGTRNGGTFYRLPAYQPDRETSVSRMISRTAEEVRGAVERQMVADVELGAFLSGGLDSSAIVAFAREYTLGRMQCFTIDYAAQREEAGELIADLPYARRVAQHLGVDLHIVQVNSSMADEFERLIYLLDEPEADPAALNSLHIAAAARANGIKVLLSGTGGDDVFTGYRRHRAAQIDNYVDMLPRPLRTAAAAAARRLPVGSTLVRRIRKFADSAARDSNSRLESYFEWISPELAADMLTISGEDTAAEVRAPLRRVLGAAGTANAVERTLRLDQQFFLTDHNLNYTDKTGMAEGVEIRVPLLDPQLVAFAASVPTGLKLHGGTTKWIFRKAMEPYLPKEVIYRPKTGFGVPLRAWLRGPMRPMLEELTSDRLLRERGLFRPAAITEIKRRTLDNSMDGSYTLLGVMAMELWCRAFIDGAPVNDRAELSGRALSAAAARS